MKIRSHTDSHIVELEDGSRWQVFPGDLDLTLDWKPETELTVVETGESVGSHLLVGEGVEVRAIPDGESWPIKNNVCVAPIGSSEPCWWLGAEAVAE